MIKKYPSSNLSENVPLLSILHIASMLCEAKSATDRAAIEMCRLI